MAIYTIINNENKAAKVYGSLVSLIDNNKHLGLSTKNLAYRFNKNNNYIKVNNFDIYKSNNIIRSKKKGIKLLLDD